MAGFLDSLSIEQQVQANYIGYFGRAADAPGLDYWVNSYAGDLAQGESGGQALSSIANYFTPQIETFQLYPFLVNSFNNTGTVDDAQAQDTPEFRANLEQVVVDIYHHLFGRTVAASDAGVQYWVNDVLGDQVIPGTNPPQFSAPVGLGDIIRFIANGALGADAEALQAKITCAEYFTAETRAAGLDPSDPGFLEAARHAVDHDGTISTAECMAETDAYVANPTGFIVDASVNGVPTTAVDEGQTVFFDIHGGTAAPGTAYSYTIEGVSGADVSGPLTGTVTLDSNGEAVLAVTLTNDGVTEGQETLTVQFPSVPGTAGGQTSAPITVNDTSTSGNLGVTAVDPSSPNVSEGTSAAFTVQTDDAAGTVLPYTISGVQAADIVGGQLAGSVTVGSDGNATILVPLAVDGLTENETLKVTVDGVSGSSHVVDSNVDPQATLTPSATSVEEGQTVQFLLHAPDAVSGTAFAYTIGGTGITAADIAGGQLTGNAIVDGNGNATITIGLVEDGVAEGTEHLALTVSGKTQTVAVSDATGTPNPPATVTYTAAYFDMDHFSLLLPTNLETDTVQVIVNGVTVQGNATNLAQNIEALTGLSDADVQFTPGVNAGNQSNSILTVTLPYGEGTGITGASFVDGTGTATVGPPVYHDASGVIVGVVAIPSTEL